MLKTLFFKDYRRHFSQNTKANTKQKKGRVDITAYAQRLKKANKNFVGTHANNKKTIFGVVPPNTSVAVNRQRVESLARRKLKALLYRNSDAIRTLDDDRFYTMVTAVMKENLPKGVTAASSRKTFNQLANRKVRYGSLKCVKAVNTKSTNYHQKLNTIQQHNLIYRAKNVKQLFRYLKGKSSLRSLNNLRFRVGAIELKIRKAIEYTRIPTKAKHIGVKRILHVMQPLPKSPSFGKLNSSSSYLGKFSKDVNIPVDLSQSKIFLNNRSSLRNRFLTSAYVRINPSVDYLTALLWI